MKADKDSQYPYVKFSKNRSIEVAEKIYEQRIKDSKFIFEKYRNDFVNRSCPFCGGNCTEEKQKFHGTYSIVKCDHCCGEYVNPAPPLDALTDYYNTCECNKMLDDLYKKRQKTDDNPFLDIRVQKVVEIIEKKSIDEVSFRILEVGCGSGSFLNKLRMAVVKKGIDVTLEGVDIDANAVASPVDSSLVLNAAPIEEFVVNKKGEYDLIIHFELIEHLIDPFIFMGSIKKLLKSNGTILFTTPNNDGLENVASNYNSFRLIAHSIFPPMHLNAFSVATCTLFAYRLGLKINYIETPGKMDVDMVCCASGTNGFDESFGFINELTDEQKGKLQHVITNLNASSHMLVCLSN